MSIPINSGFDLRYCNDKQTLFEYYCNYTMTRTQSMFEYVNLPDTIPAKWLEYYLQTNGSCCIAKVNGQLYALLGGVGGELDEYYQPTQYIVSNPALDLSESYTIGTDCVYCKNDFMGYGLVPLVSRYAGLMAENVLTIRQSDISMRNLFLLSAPDDDTYQSTKHFVEELEAGRLSVVGDSAFFDGVKMQSNSHGTGDYMIQFIELQQYLKGSLYNELGLNANFNMKREALSGDEIAMNDDALMPLIDNMLKMRREFVGEINNMFGTNIEVDYGSTWHSNVQEKALIVESDYDADEVEQANIAGSETTLTDDGDVGVESSILSEENGDDVSQLTDVDKDTVVEDKESIDSGDANGNIAGDKSQDIVDDYEGVNVEDNDDVSQLKESVDESGSDKSISNDSSENSDTNKQSKENDYSDTEQNKKIKEKGLIYPKSKQTSKSTDATNSKIDTINSSENGEDDGVDIDKSIKQNDKDSVNAIKKKEEEDEDE